MCVCVWPFFACVIPCLPCGVALCVPQHPSWRRRWTGCGPPPHSSTGGPQTREWIGTWNFEQAGCAQVGLACPYAGVLPGFFEGAHVYSCCQPATSCQGSSWERTCTCPYPSCRRALRAVVCAGTVGAAAASVPSRKEDNLSSEQLRARVSEDAWVFVCVHCFAACVHASVCTALRLTHCHWPLVVLVVLGKLSAVCVTLCRLGLHHRCACAHSFSAQHWSASPPRAHTCTSLDAHAFFGGAMLCAHRRCAWVWWSGLWRRWWRAQAGTQG